MAWLTPDAHIEALEAAREIVLRRLDRGPAPRAALVGLLERRQVDPQVAAEALDRLEAAGVLDDAAYAAMLARTRFAEKGTARRGIAEELRRKGLGEGHIAAALDQIGADQAALGLARRRMRTMTHLGQDVQRRRLVAFLGRRGYDAETVRSTVDAVLAGADPD